MSTIPFSNPAGNNQFNPTGGLKSVTTGGINAGIPGLTTSTGPGMGTVSTGTLPVSRPRPEDSTTATPITAASVTGATPASSGVVPAAAQTTSSSGSTANTSAQNGFITNNSSYSSGENDLQKQLIDIYGKGTGGSLYALLNNMSGTNSTILQEFIQSLGPQEAQAQASTNAALGAGGVSANSSVAAIADSNLQAQEFAAISGESAQLTQSQEELTANILSGMENKSSAEVSTSAWSTFGNVMGDISSDVGTILGLGKNSNKSSNTGAASTSSGSSNSAYNAIPGSSNSIETTGDTAGLDTQFSSSDFNTDDLSAD